MSPAAWARWTDLRADFGADWPFFCDVFCEKGAFDLAQTRRIQEATRTLGFRLKLHVDEFASLGGTPLAVAFGAVSVDHIVTTPTKYIALLAASGTVGVALPGTPFGLAQRDYTPGRALIDHGVCWRCATNLKPGTSWCESMQLMQSASVSSASTTCLFV